MEEYEVLWKISWLLEQLNKTVSGFKTHKRQELFQIPPSITLLLFIAYGTICVLALIGNIFVLWLVLPTKRMWSVTNLFLANLAVADIIISIFTIPFQFQAALLQRWELPHFLCSICPFVQALSVLVSVLTLSAIAVKRYKAVVYTFASPTSKRAALLAISFIWIISIFLSLPTYLDYSVVDHQFEYRATKTTLCLRTNFSKDIRWYYSFILILAQYFVPLVIITCAYARMGYLLCRRELPGNPDEIRDARFKKKNKRVAKAMSCVVLMFALCWCPYQTYQLVSIFYPKINDYQYINIIWFVMHWLAMSNSCCNPFIYAIYNDKFQAEFKSRSSSCVIIVKCCALDRTYNDVNVFEMRRVRG